MCGRTWRAIVSARPPEGMRLSTRNPLGLRTNQRPCANTQSQRLCPSRKSSVRRVLLARCEAELRGAARPIGNRRAFATLLSRCHSPWSKQRRRGAHDGETGVPIEEVAVIGDGCNDIAMFAQCPFSIAMGNASEEVKAKARLVTASNEEDGFARAVKRYLLSRDPESAWRCGRIQVIRSFQDLVKDMAPSSWRRAASISTSIPTSAKQSSVFSQSPPSERSNTRFYVQFGV